MENVGETELSLEDTQTKDQNKDQSYAAIEGQEQEENIYRAGDTILTIISGMEYLCLKMDVTDSKYLKVLAIEEAYLDYINTFCKLSIELSDLTTLEASDLQIKNDVVMFADQLTNIRTNYKCCIEKHRNELQELAELNKKYDDLEGMCISAQSAWDEVSSSTDFAEQRLEGLKNDTHCISDEQTKLRNVLEDRLNELSSISELAVAALVQKNDLESQVIQRRSSLKGSLIALSSEEGRAMSSNELIEKCKVDIEKVTSEIENQKKEIEKINSEDHKINNDENIDIDDELLNKLEKDNAILKEEAEELVSVAAEWDVEAKSLARMIDEAISEQNRIVSEADDLAEKIALRRRMFAASAEMSARKAAKIRLEMRSAESRQPFSQRPHRTRLFPRAECNSLQ